LEWLASHFGKPYVAVDRTIRASDIEVDDRQSEWEIGRSRIRGKCLAYSDSESKIFIAGYFTIEFTSKAATSRARPLVAVSCSQHFHEARGLDIGKGVDRVIVIDEDMQQILRQDNTLLGGDTVITDKSVLVKNFLDIKGSTLEIDRITGTLRSKVDAEANVVVTGTCEPIDLQRRKF
jgi:hypothetical protein